MPGYRYAVGIVALMALVGCGAYALLGGARNATKGKARMESAAPAHFDMPAGKEVATLAGGCFWCTEAIFTELRGVDKVVSGYAGGTVANPSYEQVCSGRTGHAEAIQITFDPKVISYGDLLHIFMTVHDPTTLNQQGADVGTQYRSAIFYHNDAQKKAAEKALADIAKEHIWPHPIVTEVTPYSNFYAAENYHQDYFARNPGQGYCAAVIAPKVIKFRQKYTDRLKK